MLARNNAGRGTARGVASVSPIKLAWALIPFGGLGIAAQGSLSQKSSARPTIEFTKVPPAAREAGRGPTRSPGRQKRSPKTADRYPHAQWDEVGAALA
jgi:hypothetical protein